MDTRRLRGILLLCVTLVALRAAAYWAACAWTRPGEPLSVSAMWRLGDVEDYPLVASLARFSFGDPVLWERAGAGLTSYPVLALLPHAFFKAIFGAAGYVVADVVVAVAFFLALRALLLLFGFSEGLASVAALAPALLSKPAVSTDSYVNYFPVNFWGWRIPRPFVSEIFFIAALAALWRIFRPGARTGRRDWALAGLGLALAVQTQVHAAFALFLALPFWALASGRPSAEESRRGAGAALAAFAAFVAPFFVQRLLEHPDSPVRCGMFAVKRFRPLFPDVNPAVWGMWAYGLLVAWALPKFVGRRGETPRAALVFVSIYALAAFFAGPVSWIALARTIQPVLFGIQFAKAVSIGCFVAILAVLEAAAALMPPRVMSRAAKAATAALLAAGVASSAAWAHGLAANGFAMRGSFDEYRSLGSRYREDFGELARELGKPAYRGCRVIGTLDHQVYAWWLGFEEGKSFVPDPLQTTAGDAEVERRLAAFARLVGVGEEAFAGFAARPYVNVFWLGHDKYQASRAHTLRPIGAYPPAAARRILATSPFDCWHVELPAEDASRLAALYRAAKPVPEERLDLVVLDSHAAERGLAPSEDAFEPVFSNGTFRAWRRRAQSST